MNIEYLLRVLPYEMKLPNLGGRSTFTVKNSGRKVLIVNSSQRILVLNIDLLSRVYARYSGLGENERLQAGQYVDENWTNCPNRTFSPLIAKLIDFLVARQRPNNRL